MERITEQPAQTATATEEARRKLGEMGSKARIQVKHQVEEAVHHAKDVVKEATDQGSHLISNEQARWSDRVSRFGGTARSVAQRLREEDNGMLAEYAETCAAQLDRLSDYLRRKDFRGLFNDAQEVGRRHPEILFGGMFLGGLILARFLKASAKPRQRTFDEWNMDERPFGEPGDIGSNLDIEQRGPRTFGDSGFGDPDAGASNAGVAASQRGAASLDEPRSFTETESRSTTENP